MPKFLGIHGTVTAPGRLHQALQLALEYAGNKQDPVETCLLHLGDHQISFADGRPPANYPDDTGKVVEQVIAADMYLIATPIFRASFSASLKNLLDLVPVESLMGKPCGLIGMGATDHHYLAIDTQLRPVLAWFGAHVVPGEVYLKSSHFQDGRLVDAPAIAGLESITEAVIAAQQAISERSEMMGPKPLAAS